MMPYQDWGTTGANTGTSLLDQYANGGPTRSPSLADQYAYGGPTRSPATQSSGGGFLAGLTSLFSAGTTLAENVATVATGGAQPAADNPPDDGASDWLSQLPRLGAAVLDAIGANTPQEQAPVQQVGYRSGGGIDVTTIALIAGLGLGIYVIATR